MASVGSKEELEQFTQIANGEFVWLGGRRHGEGGSWQWLDGRSWDYQNGEILSSAFPGNCLYKYASDESWRFRNCSRPQSFVCTNPSPKEISGTHKMVLGKIFLHKSTLFYFWWSHNLDGKDNQKRGLQLSWQVENGSLPDLKEVISKELSGSVSTPGLGSIPPPNYYSETHEYTAVIELPHNITDVIDDDALVVDVDVTIPDNETGRGVEILTSILTTRVSLSITSAILCGSSMTAVYSCVSP